MDDDVRMDAAELADRIARLVTGRLGLRLSVTRRDLATTIRQYVEARQWAGAYRVSVKPPPTEQIPDGWTAHDESVWQWWLSDKVSAELWNAVVIGPVFGTDVRVWETMGSEWRQELLYYLPRWIQRSLDIVSRVDPMPRPEEEAETDGRGWGAEESDLYGSEHAGKGGRRRR